MAARIARSDDGHFGPWRGWMLLIAALCSHMAVVGEPSGLDGLQFRHAHTKWVAPNVRGVDHKQCLGQSGSRPRRVSAPPRSLGRFVIDCVHQAQTDGNPRRRFWSQMAARQHPCDCIHCERDPGTTNFFAALLLNINDVCLGMVQLNDFREPRRPVCIRRWIRAVCGTRSFLRTRPAFGN